MYLALASAKPYETTICDTLMAKRCERWIASVAPLPPQRPEPGSGHDFNFSARCPPPAPACGKPIGFCHSSRTACTPAAPSNHLNITSVTQLVSVHSIVCNPPGLSWYHIFVRLKQPSRQSRNNAGNQTHPDGSQFAQMGSHFAQITTPNPCTQPSHTPVGDMYIPKTPPTPPQNTPFPGLNLKVGKMNYSLGNLDPKWAKCWKIICKSKVYLLVWQQGCGPVLGSALHIFWKRV